MCVLKPCGSRQACRPGQASWSALWTQQGAPPNAMSHRGAYAARSGGIRSVSPRLRHRVLLGNLEALRVRVPCNHGQVVSLRRNGPDDASTNRPVPTARLALTRVHGMQCFACLHCYVSMSHSCSFFAALCMFRTLLCMPHAHGKVRLLRPRMPAVCVQHTGHACTH